MSQLKNYSTLIFAVLFLFASCDKGSTLKDEALKSIPKDVSSVTTVDLPTMMKKADFDNVKTMEFYQEVIKEASEYNAALGDVVADPAKSGIDLSKSIYIVNELNPDNPEEWFAGVVFTLKNADAFGELIQAQQDAKITKGDNFEMLSKRNQSVAWNDKLAVFGSTNSYNDITPTLAKYFTNDPENSVANDKNLQKCLSEKHDITSWMSSNALAQNEQVKMFLPLANIDPEALNDNFIHSYVDFNDGKIVGHSSTFLNKGLTKDLKLLFKDEVKTDFSSYVSADGLNSLITAALDLKGMKQIIAERPQGMAYLNFMLKQYGVTLDDVSNTFGGDIMVSTFNNDGNPKGLFATDIKDAEGLQKIIDLGIEYEMIEKLGEDHYLLKNNSFNTYSPSSYGADEAQLIVKDDILFASFSGDVINEIKEGKVNGSIDKKLMHKVSDNVFGLYMDYEVLAEMVTDEVDVKISTMEIAAKRKNSDFLLNFKDESSNSLKQLFEMMNEMYLNDKNPTVDKTEI